MHQVAQHVQEVLEGFRALVALQASASQAGGDDIARHFQIETDGRTVTVEWTADSEQAIQFLRTLIEQRRSELQERAAKKGGADSKVP